MKSVWTKFTHYNCWANEQMAAIFSGVPEEMTNREIVSSFPSVRLTMLHIWDAEFVWLKRLQGASLSPFPSKSFTGNMKAVCENVVNISQEFQAFVEGQPEEYFEIKISYKTLSLEAYQQRAYEMIQHSLNHSTYHRGQLVMMARQLGVEKIPSTDFIFFLRQEEV
jgi:uncharacterized damage-inducible protein DinB